MFRNDPDRGIFRRGAAKAEKSVDAPKLDAITSA